MLERHFLKPETLERIRGSWLGAAIERYVDWMDENGYSTRSVVKRVPVLVQFGEFTKSAGVKDFADLPAYAEPFTKHWISQHGQNAKTRTELRSVAYEASNPIGQMLRLLLQNSTKKPSSQKSFQNACLLDFLKYLQEERGLSPRTIKLYRHCLKRLEDFLAGIGISDLGQLSPPVVSAFLTDSRIVGKKGPQQGASSVLRILVRFLHREGILARDFSSAVERTKKYKFSELPRSISWEQVRLMLESVDTRTALGRRDFAMLLLMVTYGLRAREIASLTLDDFDWKRNKFHVPERKAGHSTTYPLSAAVGSAIIDYLKNGRPSTNDRHIFFRVSAPMVPMNFQSVSMRATHYLKRAGIPVSRPGSHTLRHTCVQRLLDSHVLLKTIGDYVGHASPQSTQIYAKVDIHKLRDVALGYGEDIV